MTSGPWMPLVRRRRGEAALEIAGAWLLGALPAALRVAGHGPDGRRGALVLAVGGLGAVVLLCRRAPGAAPSVPLRLARWLVVIGVLVLAAGLSTPFIGRAPAMVVAASTVAASLALHDGRDLVGWPSRSTRVARLAVATSALAGLTWLRSASLVATAVALLAGAIILDLYHRRPEGVVAAERALSSVVDMVGRTVGLVIVTIFAVPLLYLPAGVVMALRRVAAWLRPRPSPVPIWSDPIAASLAERQAVSPYVPPNTDRRNRTWAKAVAVVIVVSVGVGAGLLARPGPTSQPGDGPLGVEFVTEYSSLDVFDGVPFADELQREQLGYDAEMRGRFTNVVDGVRSTKPPPDCACAPATVWLLGGSAAFGIGQRDDHTIASALVEVARADGAALTVRNLAVPGDTIWDQYGVLQDRLRTVAERPDVVLFYDGFNDVVARLTTTSLHGLDRDARSVMVNDDLISYNAERPPVRVPGGAAAIGRIAADEYLEVVELVDRLAGQHGADVLNVFQADALGSDVQLEGYEELIGVSPSELRASDLAAALDAAERRLHAEAPSLRSMFDDEERQVFIGLVHTDEIGAAKTAVALWDLLGPVIDRRRS